MQARIASRIDDGPFSFMRVDSIRQRVGHFQRSGGQDDAHSLLQSVDRDDSSLMEWGTNKDAGKLGQRSACDANGIAGPETRAMEAVHRELLDHWPLSRQETKKADAEEHPKGLPLRRPTE
jgi:hypothetical protein